jgi:hypothetical protein
MEKFNLVQLVDEWPDDMNEEEHKFDEEKFKKDYSKHYKIWMRNALFSNKDEQPT